MRQLSSLYIGKYGLWYISEVLRSFGCPESHTGNRMTAVYFSQTVDERPSRKISGKTIIGKSGIKLIIPVWMSLSPSCHSGSDLVARSGAQMAPGFGALERSFAIIGLNSSAWSEQDASASEKSRLAESWRRFHWSSLEKNWSLAESKELVEEDIASNGIDNWSSEVSNKDGSEVTRELECEGQLAVKMRTRTGNRIFKMICNEDLACWTVDIKQM